MKVSEIIVSKPHQDMDEIAANPMASKFYKFYLHHHHKTNDFVYPVDDLYSPDIKYNVLEKLYEFEELIVPFQNCKQMNVMVKEMIRYFNG